jgi:glycosyltransferase involved in cell wall biosynthesis
MRFSILVPCYNGEATIEECVGSVLNQSFGDWELVLVDDGSIDASGAICDNLAAAHPDRIRAVHQPNGGLIAARRRGIQEAAGDYCLFLDADDAFERESLSLLDECLTLTGAEMILFPYEEWYEKSGIRIPGAPVFRDGSVFMGMGKEPVYEELIRSWRLNNLCTKCIQTSLLKNDPTDYGAFGKNPYTEDLLQTLYPITMAEKIAYLATPLYLYRKSPESISAKAEPGKISQQLNTPVMDLLRTFMTKWGMEDPKNVDAFCQRKMQGMATLFWQYWRAAATREQKKALMEYPWEQHLTAEDKAFLKSGSMRPRLRTQITAILGQKKAALTLIGWTGAAMMRIRHGA